MAFNVYILRCGDGSYYVGHTDNLEMRLVAHELGEVPGYTKGKQPLELVFQEEFQTREDAFARERQIKGWSRAKKEALVNDDWQRVRLLSERRTSQP